MAKIISIQDTTITIARDSGEIVTADRKDCDFDPQIGQHVEIVYTVEGVAVSLADAPEGVETESPESPNGVATSVWDQAANTEMQQASSMQPYDSQAKAGQQAYGSESAAEHQQPYASQTPAGQQPAYDSQVQDGQQPYGLQGQPAGYQQFSAAYNPYQNPAGYQQPPAYVAAPVYPAQPVGYAVPVVGVRAVNKMVYIVLAIFFGGLGVHQMYAGRVGIGILYLLFVWTFIPSFIALIDIIVMALKPADIYGNVWM